MVTYFTRVLTSALTLALLTVSPAVLAHAHLQNQSPAADAQVSVPVNHLTLTFSEDIEPGLSQVNVFTQPGNQPVPGLLKSNPSSRNELLMTFKQPLAAGHYQVNWQVISVDSHKTQGSYDFSVQ